MPELVFKGKEFVYNHHLSVPFRPLIPSPSDSIGSGVLTSNLIIHGDNLQALKAILPRFASSVDMIYIDPPYNTGEENWCYNDNVNSPVIQEWFNSNPIGIEDTLRHDKWLAMMWPRLRLLHQLLADHGVIFVSIDDNESHRLRAMMDEIFGADNFLATIVARLNPKGRHLGGDFFAKTHEYVLAYAKVESLVQIQGLSKTDSMLAEYDKEDEVFGKYRLLELRNRNGAFNPETRSNLYYPIYVEPETGFVSLEKSDKFSETALPHDSDDQPTVWTWNRAKVAKDVALLVARSTREGKWRVFRRDFLIGADGEEAQTKPKTIWLDLDLNMDSARKTVNGILGRRVFDYPKPVPLIRKLIDLAAIDGSLVLDSFAGSGTTGQAVLDANAEDSGSRRFILVEMEDYANTVTAERVRRVITGYNRLGKSREQLYSRKVNLRDLKKASVILADLDRIEAHESPRFDRIKKTMKDGVIQLIGEKDEQQFVPGVSGEFTFCTLGQALDLDGLLTGKSLPDVEQLGAILYHMATNEPFNVDNIEKFDNATYLGRSGDSNVWLIYQASLDFLKSANAALTLDRARELSLLKPSGKHIVYAPSRFVSRKTLAENALPVEFAPLPFALFQIDMSRTLLESPT